MHRRHGSLSVRTLDATKGFDQETRNLNAAGLWDVQSDRDADRSLRGDGCLRRTLVPGGHAGKTWLFLRGRHGTRTATSCPLTESTVVGLMSVRCCVCSYH